MRVSFRMQPERIVNRLLGKIVVRREKMSMVRITRVHLP